MKSERSCDNTDSRRGQEQRRPSSKKRRRGRRRSGQPTSRNHDTSTKTVVIAAAGADLFVPLPRPSSNNNSSSIARVVLTRNLIKRLATTGYQTVALTHTVYGKPQDPADRVDQVLCREALRLSNIFQDKNDHASRRNRVTMYRRLHCVLENLSDVAVFGANPDASSSLSSSSSRLALLLQEYDLISIAPRNEAVFRSLLTTPALACDILTLDYTVQGSALPFRIRPVDMQHVVERNMVLEIPYAAAVLQPAHRAAWIHTSRAVQQASRGLSHKTLQSLLLLTSSGERRRARWRKAPEEQGLHPSHSEGGVADDDEASTLALRTARDAQNLAHTVLGFASASSFRAAQGVLHRAQTRRMGGSNLVTKVAMGKTRDLMPGEGKPEQEEETNMVVAASKTNSRHPTENNDTLLDNSNTDVYTGEKRKGAEEHDADEDRGEDGFISF